MCSYVILGDGCNMEGISTEAASLAGHWGLGKLIALYDDNHISIDGDTSIAFTEDVSARFEALGWHTIWVKDGNTDLDALRKAIAEAKAVTDKPTMIKVREQYSWVVEQYCWLCVQSFRLLRRAEPGQPSPLLLPCCARLCPAVPPFALDGRVGSGSPKKANSYSRERGRGTHRSCPVPFCAMLCPPLAVTGRSRPPLGSVPPTRPTPYAVHGAALGDKEVTATRENLKWPYAPFEIPEEVYK